MKIVYKYEVPIDKSGVNIPYGSNILKVGFQDDGKMYIWAEVDADANMMHRDIQIFSTGEELKAGSTYCHLGTDFISGLVFHVYDIYKAS